MKLSERTPKPSLGLFFRAECFNRQFINSALPRFPPMDHAINYNAFRIHSNSLWGAH